MFPLLKKDGLTVPYVVCQLTLICIESFLTLRNDQKSRVEESDVFRRLRFLSMSGCVALHILDFSFPQGTLPMFANRYPDLILVMFAVYSFAHFALAFLYLHLQHWSLLNFHQTISVSKKTSGAKQKPE
jgi:hypothetical protein